MSVNVIAIGIGGFFGALLRYLLGQSIHLSSGFPIATLVINLLGCLFLAWFLTVTTHRWTVREEIRAGIGTGLTGAFTTFSAFSVETLQLIESQQFFAAILYVAASVFGGVLMSLAGARWGLWQSVRGKSK